MTSPPLAAEEMALAAEQRWHGWSIGGKALHVGPLPGRKSICLYTVDGAVLDVLAYFRSEQRAEQCLAWLDLAVATREQAND